MTQKYMIRFTILAGWVALAGLVAVVCANTDNPPPDEKTWLLKENQEWRALSAAPQDKFLLAVAEIKKQVDKGKCSDALKGFNQLKKDFPEIAGPDLDLFIEAEIARCQGKSTKAISTYDKLLTDFRESRFRQAALERQFRIASAFLAGQKKAVLGVFKIKGYEEGIKIMEKITDRETLDTPIGTQAAVAVAKNYEQREMFNEAYFKWSEIALFWQTGEIGKEALLAMARCKHAAYNKPEVAKRPLFDASGLKTARSHYEKFKLLYPEDANQIAIDEKLKEIDEQLAYKEFTIGRYYHRTGHPQAANLYYDMVMNNWPNTETAQKAKMEKQKLIEDLTGKEQTK